MTDRPWWYSGGEGEPRSGAGSEPAPEPVGSGLPTVDWTALASGAQRLVDWATERVMAPHSEHDDPRAHPQCVICRAMLLMGDRPPAADERPSTSPPAEDIVWIPIVGD